MMFKFNIAPVPKPRMTQSDRWKLRPPVARYRAFCDELRLNANLKGYILEEVLSVHFIIPMPKSWSKKKKGKYNNKPHTQKPDLDNLIKAFQDALAKEDSHVHTYNNCKKEWGHEPAIFIF